MFYSKIRQVDLATFFKHERPFHGFHHLFLGQCAFWEASYFFCFLRLLENLCLTRLMKQIIITLDVRAQFQQKSLRQTNLPETLPHKSFIENKYKIRVLKFLCIFQQAFNASPLTVRHLFLSNRHLIRTALFQILRLKCERSDLTFWRSNSTKKSRS